MLSEKERNQINKIERGKLEDHFKRIASLVRLSGSEGERKSQKYIVEQLDSSGIKWKEHKSQALLSTPVNASLVIKGKNISSSIQVKTWSFSGSFPQGVRGKPVLDLSNDGPQNPLDFFCSTSYEKDLEGTIVVAPWRGPVPVIIAQARGAAGYIALWTQGKEAEIHEGIVSFIWGTPSPWENNLFLSMPFVATSYEEGRELVALVESDPDDLEITINTEVFERVQELSTIEATCPGAETDEDCFVLLGSHLDSWHHGATDNATGNALGLSLAQTLCLNPIGLNVRICWWSGHSEGRYAGSSLFARDSFDELSRCCLAVMNADVPGMIGAGDYHRLAVGPDLFELAAETVMDLTGQTGAHFGPVRGWDQSFQNIGVSPYFVWSSLLPDRSPVATGDGTMGWWWHTEKDLPQYSDINVLLNDASLYLLALERLSNNLGTFPDPKRLLGFLLSKIDELPGKYLSIFSTVKVNLQTCCEILERKPLLLKSRIRVIRLLNRMLYCWKSSFEQDWAINSKYLPGARMALEILSKNGNDARRSVVAENFLIAQRNRLISLTQDLLATMI